MCGSEWKIESENERANEREGELRGPEKRPFLPPSGRHENLPLCWLLLWEQRIQVPCIPFLQDCICMVVSRLCGPCILAWWLILWCCILYGAWSLWVICMLFITYIKKQPSHPLEVNFYPIWLFFFPDMSSSVETIMKYSKKNKK